MSTRPLIFLIAVAALGGGCGGGAEVEATPPTVDCDVAEVLTYSELEIWPHCTNCHAVTLTGANRQGAPVGIDYDTYESAKNLAWLGVEEVTGGTMPFTGTVSEEAKEEFYAWALCGTPQ